MAVDNFHIKQNDTRPTLRRTLQNADGSAIDLSTATAVRFHMRRSGTVKVDSNASIVDAPNGVVEYAWAAGDTDTPGGYAAEFEVTFTGGAPLTVPNQATFFVVIGSELA